ncbi:response regulator [Acetobacter musti]|uniref:Response regulator n=1 Tax=Acetobacter musti TaxID=864732 RepID=A0ABX0JS83_9PROT|nr:response regulator transcription factor [Acetobacter musti]NHN86036.1 response regulator [Acetobacter musti]
MNPMIRPRLLLVEDDSETADYVQEGLGENGINVVAVTNGSDGLMRALSEPWDIVIIDRMLPGLDGLTILTRMRTADVMTPVLFLTTMDGVPSRVNGLRHGADDYMIKPFALRELVARVQVLLRRSGPLQHTTVLRVEDVELDLLTRTVTRSGEKIFLQPQEMKLLEYFMRNPGTVVSRQMLLKDVWHMEFPVRTNIVETHLSRLREKLGRNERPLIRTVRGAGYVMGEIGLDL